MRGGTVGGSQDLLNLFLKLRSTVERRLKAVQDAPEMNFTEEMEFTEMHRSVTAVVNALKGYVRLMTNLRVDDPRSGLDIP